MACFWSNAKKYNFVIIDDCTKITQNALQSIESTYTNRHEKFLCQRPLTSRNVPYKLTLGWYFRFRVLPNRLSPKKRPLYSWSHAYLDIVNLGQPV